MKIFLLILILGSDGNIEGAIPATFETMKQCEEQKHNLPSPPQGFTLRAYCVDPKQTLI